MRVASAVYLLEQPCVHRLVDRAPAHQEREVRNRVGIQAETVDPVLALQEVARVEGAIEIHGVMAPVVQAHSLSARRRIGQEHRTVRIVPKTVELQILA